MLRETASKRCCCIVFFCFTARNGWGMALPRPPPPICVRQRLPLRSEPHREPPPLALSPALPVAAQPPAGPSPTRRGSAHAHSPCGAVLRQKMARDAFAAVPPPPVAGISPPPKRTSACVALLCFPTACLYQRCAKTFFPIFLLHRPIQDCSVHPSPFGRQKVNGCRKYCGGGKKSALPLLTQKKRDKRIRDIFPGKPFVNR